MQCEATNYNRSVRLASGDEVTFADVGDAQVSLTAFSDASLNCSARRWAHCGPCMSMRLPFVNKMKRNQVLHEA